MPSKKHGLLLLWACFMVFPDPADLYVCVPQLVDRQVFLKSAARRSEFTSNKAAGMANHINTFKQDKRTSLEPRRSSCQWAMNSVSSKGRPALAEGLREREITLQTKEGRSVPFYVVEAEKTTDMVDDWIQEQMPTVSCAARVICTV